MKWKHLREEIDAHLEEKAQELMEAGVPEKEAWTRARREFGNPELIAETGREVWGWIWLEDFFKDLRYAFRTMLSNRVFTALAVTSLALGIGANTAIYSFMDSILLRSLPVKDPASLVVINWHTPVQTFSGGAGTTVVRAMSGTIYDDETGSTASIMPYPAFEALQKSGSVFSRVFAFRGGRRLNVAVKGEAGVATGEYVSGDYFRGLGVAPATGRMLIAEDDSPGAAGAAVVSFAFSQDRFGGPANAVGQPILVNNVPLTVVGVTPPEFFGAQAGRSPEVYLPMHANLRVEPNDSSTAMYLDQHYYWINTMARLNPGVSLDQAQTSMAAPFRNWAMSTATTDVQRKNLPALMLKPGATGLEALRRRFSKPLYVLMTLVGFILVIACANIANLLLARAAGRKREMAVRLSIGAGRMRVIRQLLTESVLMASIGGALGVLVAIGGIRLLSVALADGREPFVLNADLNWRVLAVTAGVTLLTGIVFGLAPAIQSTKVDVMPALKEIRAGEARSRRVSLSHILVSAQIALSLLMLVAAGLFLRTLANLQSVDLGFNRENVLLFTLNARQAGHGDADIARFYEDLRTELGTIPGVQGVSLSHEPLIRAGSGSPIHLPGAQRDGETRLLYAGAEFFKTMQISMVAGREFESRDQNGSAQVAVVSEQFARKNFGKENPLGRRLVMDGRDPREMEIIGVAKEAHYGGLKQKVPPVVYMPYVQGRQSIVGQMTFVMRTSGDPFAYVSAVRDVVRRADARVPLANVKTQTAVIDETIYQELAFAKLCAAFALLALTVACVGLYGTVSYQVARRTGEIGIRMALGARRAGVVWMVLREVFVVTAVGLGISVPLALALSGLVASFLYGIKPNDPAAFGLAVVALVCAAIVAGYVPARRAARIDPMVALRYE